MIHVRRSKAVWRVMLRKRTTKHRSIWDLIYILLAAVVIISIILIITPAYRHSRIPSGFSFAAVDVGQGQSIVLTSGSSTAVVDCGSASIDDPGMLTAEYLKEEGRSRIDLLILSHYRSDHTNGLPRLASMVDIGAILMPVPQEEDAYISDRIISLADRSGIDIVYIDRDLSIELGDAELTLYAPMGGETENENCVIVLCTQKNFDVLITADSPSVIEYSLLDHADLPDIEILVVGHHGSAGSTSQDLLETVQPEIAVISVGENDYGHPAGSVIRRLNENGITVYRTDESGTITFAPEQNG